MQARELLERRFLVFAAVGAVGTATQYLILILLVQLADVHSVAASTLGFLAGAIVNYILNYRITFKSNNKHAEAVSKFFSIAFIGLILNAILMSVFAEIFQFHYLLAQIISTGIVLIWNYWGNSRWTFSVSDQNEPR